MRLGEGLRNPAIAAGLDEAIARAPARVDALYKHLELASGLPGPRANLGVAQAFANECAARGKKADALLFAMAALDAEAAAGATSREFLPVCGILGLGARAADEPKLRARVLGVLHEAAEDLRFRVREAVPLALARVGEAAGDALVRDVAPWMDGLFHAAAVLSAMADPRWLPRIDDAEEAIARLDEAFALARDAPRSASRYPGYKALVDALAVAPAALASRFGVKVLDRLAAWSATDVPVLRDAIAKNLASPKIATRLAGAIANVRGALDASKTPPRDPTILVQGMRGRGKKRSRR